MRLRSKAKQTKQKDKREPESKYLGSNPSTLKSIPFTQEDFKFFKLLQIILEQDRDALLPSDKRPSNIFTNKFRRIIIQ